MNRPPLWSPVLKLKCICHHHKAECDCVSDLKKRRRTFSFWLWLAGVVVAAIVFVICLVQANAEEVPPERWCPVYRLWAATRAPLALPRGARSSYMLTSPAAERICLEQGTKEEAARKAAPHSPKAR